MNDEPIPVAVPPEVRLQFDYQIVDQRERYGITFNGVRFNAVDTHAYEAKLGAHTAEVSTNGARWFVRIDTVLPSGSKVVSGRWNFLEPVAAFETAANNLVRLNQALPE